MAVGHSWCIVSIRHGGTSSRVELMQKWGHQHTHDSILRVANPSSELTNWSNFEHYRGNEFEGVMHFILCC